MAYRICAFAALLLYAARSKRQGRPISLGGVVEKN
jgi:hypothetical protein